MESMALHSPALSRSRLASYPRLSRSQSADAVYIRGYTFLLPDPLTLVPSSLSASMCTFLVLFLGLLVNSETRHREELQPNLLETQELKR